MGKFLHSIVALLITVPFCQTASTDRLNTTSNEKLAITQPPTSFPEDAESRLSFLTSLSINAWNTIYNWTSRIIEDYICSSKYPQLEIKLRNKRQSPEISRNTPSILETTDDVSAEVTESPSTRRVTFTNKPTRGTRPPIISITPQHRVRVTQTSTTVPFAVSTTPGVESTIVITTEDSSENTTTTTLQQPDATSIPETETTPSNQSELTSSSGTEITTSTQEESTASPIIEVTVTTQGEITTENSGSTSQSNSEITTILTPKISTPNLAVILDISQKDQLTTDEPNITNAPGPNSTEPELSISSESSITTSPPLQITTQPQNPQTNISPESTSSVTNTITPMPSTLQQHSSFRTALTTTNSQTTPTTPTGVNAPMLRTNPPIITMLHSVSRATTPSTTDVNNPAQSLQSTVQPDLSTSNQHVNSGFTDPPPDFTQSQSESFHPRIGSSNNPSQTRPNINPQVQIQGPKPPGSDDSTQSYSVVLPPFWQPQFITPSTFQPPQIPMQPIQPASLPRKVQCPLPYLEYVPIQFSETSRYPYFLAFQFAGRSTQYPHLQPVIFYSNQKDDRSIREPTIDDYTICVLPTDQSPFLPPRPTPVENQQNSRPNFFIPLPNPIG